MKELIRKILREQEREKMQTVSLPVSDPWPEFRKQNAKRFKDMIDAADWELFLHGLEIPEEDSEEPQVIKDLNALVLAIEDGKKDNQLIRTKEFKRLNLDKDKIAFWRNHLNKPEVQSVWAKAKNKIKDWLGGNEDGDVASKEEVKGGLKEHIKRILREQTETLQLCLPINGWLGTELGSGQKFGDCRKTCIEKDVDNNCIDWDNCGRLHKGVDLATNSGTPLLAAADGKVVAATPDDGGICGGQIKIKHADGIETLYCHCSEVSVAEEQDVKRGEVIGKSGGDASDPGNGNSSHAHLHYGVFLNGTAIDPKAAGHLDKECGDAADEELYDDDPIALLIWLNQGEVKPKEDTRTPEELIALLPDCSKKSSDDMQEDGMAIYNLWQWDYIDVPQRKDLNPLYPPDPPNITGLLDYQKKYGLQELPIDIVNGCRIPQETLDHINANEDETIVNEL